MFPCCCQKTSLFSICTLICTCWGHQSCCLPPPVPLHINYMFCCVCVGVCLWAWMCEFFFWGPFKALKKKKKRCQDQWCLLGQWPGQAVPENLTGFHYTVQLNRSQCNVRMRAVEGTCVCVCLCVWVYVYPLGTISAVFTDFFRIISPNGKKTLGLMRRDLICKVPAKMWDVNYSYDKPVILKS